MSSVFPSSRLRTTAGARIGRSSINPEDVAGASEMSTGTAFVVAGSVTLNSSGQVSASDSMDITGMESTMSEI